MGRLADLGGDCAHERRITVSIHPVEGHRVLVTGHLVDDRKKEYYLATGEKRPAGHIHDMTLRLLVRIDDLAIEDAEVEMTAVPRDPCHEAEATIDALKGLHITRGFTARVRELMGGVRGCTHLVTLLTNMGPAAVQGIWSYTSQRPVKALAGGSRRTRALFTRGLVNSCMVWREDGPTWRRLQAALAALEEEGEGE